MVHKTMNTKNKWKSVGMNSVMSGDEFYISFNPNTGIVGHGVLTEIANALSDLGDLGKKFEDGTETALVDMRKGEGFGQKKFYILTGDHRKAYEGLFDKGFEACLEYYKENQDKYFNTWSDSLEENV